MKLRRGVFVLPQHATLFIDQRPWPASELAVRLLTEAARRMGRSFRKTTTARGPGHRADVQVRLEVVGPPQSYRLRIEPKSIRLLANDEAGFRYGAISLCRLLEVADGRIQAMQIDDAPDIAVRGVMLDISRDKVPKMSELRRLIPLFASWRINQLQLYMEHTFAYRRHRVVWKNASPLTAREVRELDALCRAHGIELVPNQNGFGHMERWLRHKPYAHLAEMTGPWKTPSGSWRTQPATLNPVDPRSMKLVTGLYDELMSNFTSRKFNIGCDETWELGQGKSGSACKRRGIDQVYLEYLLKLHRHLARRRRRTMYWADIVLKYPSLIAEVPQRAIALIWGYEANHPFKKQCRQVRKAQRCFYVCPGTSSWRSFAGRTHNAEGNLLSAAKAGRATGAEGYLITDWGDAGHHQFLPVSYGPIAYGAAVSWCAKSNASADVAMEVGRHVFADPTGATGRWWRQAGNVYRASGKPLFNRTILFSIMQTRLENIARDCRLAPSEVRAVQRALAALKKLVRRARPKCADAAIVLQEMQTTQRILEHACERALLAEEWARGRLSQAHVRRLRADVEGIIRAYEKLWRARNRPGGLDSSLEYYRKLLLEYEALGQVRPALNARRRSRGAVGRRERLRRFA